jgi:hypothetical protein
MNDKKSLDKDTSSPIENNVDQSAASGVSSEEFEAESSPRDANLPASAFHSQLDGERRQRIQQAYVELGNADVVCGRGFQPDSKNGAEFDTKWASK